MTDDLLPYQDFIECGKASKTPRSEEGKAKDSDQEDFDTPTLPLEGNKETIHKAMMTGSMTGMYDETLLQTLGRFKKEHYVNLKESTQKAFDFYLGYFERFIRELHLNLKDLSHAVLDQYREWLFNQRDGHALYIKPGMIQAILSKSKTALQWFTDKGYLRECVLEEVTTQETLLLERRFNERREQNVSALRNTVDAELYKYYLALLKRHGSERLHKIAVLVLKRLLEYQRQTQKTLKALQLFDYEALKNTICQEHVISNRHHGEQYIRHQLLGLRNFETFAFEEGYLEKVYLSHWKLPSLSTLIKDTLTHCQTAKPLKKRLYTPLELMRCYKRHLHKSTSHVDSYQRKLKNVNLLFEYLALNTRSVYSADTHLIEGFKHYVKDYQYKPGYYYGLEVQVVKMSDIKRFFDWLDYEGFYKDHPLKDLDEREYRDWLKVNARESSKEKTQENWYDDILSGLIKYVNYKGHARETVQSHILGCRMFFEYMEKLGMENMKEVSKDTLRAFTQYLNTCRNAKGELLSRSGQLKRMVGVKHLFTYLEKYDLIDKVISTAIEYPKMDQGLPTTAIDNQEAKMLIESAKGDTPKSLRDRVMFELLYSSGIRSNEMCQLKLKNVDYVKGMIRVDVPKGGKNFERVVPIGKKCCEWIEKYIREGRPKGSERVHLLLNDKGEPLNANLVLKTVKSYLMKLPLNKNKVVTHSFRVGCATEMLRKGANVKVVQEQLGHRMISSTEKYLRLVPTDLKKAHSKYHPRK